MGILHAQDNNGRELFMRNKVAQVIQSQAFERFIIVVILLNSIDLGLAVQPAVTAQFGFAIEIANNVFTVIYVVELILKLFAWRSSFFKNRWNIFDLCIVAVSLIPASSFFAGARILRILKALLALRALRLVSGIKPLRKVVQAVTLSLPGIGWTGILMLLLYYVYAIVGIHLFRDISPELFGSFPQSFVTLFSLTTLEGWQDTVFPFTEQEPLTWLYFLTFLIIASFILLNLIVGIVVDSINELVRQDPNQAINEQSQIMTLDEQIEVVKKLKELCDVGALTEEEFIVKKKEVLGL